ncbi:amino acid-binding protein [bacterium]|nr:amino acid-binding protein [bacterium]
MTTSYKISIFCPDRVGLIAAITGKLFDLGINLGDSTFAVLGSGAEFTSVCDVPVDLEIKDLHQQLSAVHELKDADIAIKRFELIDIHGPTANVTHQITVKGGDNPGLVARLSEVFIEFGANIVRLNSEKIAMDNGYQYVIRISVWIPRDNRDGCLATIENTANTLQMQCQIEDHQP